MRVIQRETEPFSFAKDGVGGKPEEYPRFTPSGEQITDVAHYHIHELLFSLMPEVASAVTDIMAKGQRRVDVSYRMEGERAGEGMVKMRVGAILEWDDGKEGD